MERIENKTIFILSLMKFDGLPSTNFTVAKYLAEFNTVYYVDHPFTYKDYRNLKNTAGFNVRKPFFSSSSKGIIDTDHPNLKIVVTPPVLPINWLPEGNIYRYMLKFNESVILKRIRKIIRSGKIKDYIFINFFDFHYPDIGLKLQANLNIYYCVDPIAVPYDKKHGIKSELQLVKKSDVVICTSPALYKEKKTQNEHTYLIPNAADVDHAALALEPGLAIHSSLINIPKPILGYIGNIERRMDFDLLFKVISKHHDKSFVFAGPVSKEFIPDWFTKLENVFLPGPIAYSELPNMLKGFDLCLIPFKKDEVSATIFPLKLFEYLGAGKPVLATDFNPDLKNYTADVVKYCSDDISFSTAVDEMLKDKDQHIEHRLKIAGQNTWKERMKVLNTIVLKHL